jgi:hypothetical protein
MNIASAFYLTFASLQGVLFVVDLLFVYFPLMFMNDSCYIWGLSHGCIYPFNSHECNFGCREADESRLREVCESFLGPPTGMAESTSSDAKTVSWDPCVLVRLSVFHFQCPIPYFSLHVVFCDGFFTVCLLLVCFM